MKLTAGDKAPDFTTTDQDGKSISLSSFKGKKVVLYFYPNDMTEGCTFEACNLRDNYQYLKKAGYEVLGISTNDELSHQKFIKKEKLPFTLLADTSRAVHDMYGTWVEKSMYGRKFMGTARITFLIDEKGVIEEIIEKVNTKDHASQILKTDAKAAKPVKKTAKKTVASKTTKKVASKTARKSAAKKKSR